MSPETSPTEPTIYPPDVLVPTSEPTAPNQSGWVDEMDIGTWPAGLWSQTGDSVTPTLVSGITAWQWSLSGGQRVELRSYLSPTILSAESSTTRLLGRMVAASSQEVVLGVVDAQSDTIGSAPANGVWIQRESDGDCFLRLATGGEVSETPLSIALPSSGWFDFALELRTRPGSMMEALAFLGGVPVGVIGNVAPPVGWLWPRVGVKGAGVLALDRMGRATVGPSTGDNL